MTTRRKFLAGLMAASTPLPGWAAAGNPGWIACAQSGEDHVLCGLRADGSLAFTVPLPARGHAGAAHPLWPQAVVFARRPGNYALVIDCATGHQLQRLTPPPGQEFNGHGTFLDGGAILASCEQRAEDSEGVVGFWEDGGLVPHRVRCPVAASARMTCGYCRTAAA